MRISIALILAGLWLVIAGLAHGSNTGDLSQKTDDSGPPPAAFKPCEGKSVGSQCMARTPHGKLVGTCRQFKGTRPVCAPDGHLGPPPPLPR